MSEPQSIGWMVSMPISFQPPTYFCQQSVRTGCRVNICLKSGTVCISSLMLVQAHSASCRKYHRDINCPEAPARINSKKHPAGPKFLSSLVKIELFLLCFLLLWLFLTFFFCFTVALFDWFILLLLLFGRGGVGIAKLKWATNHLLFFRSHFASFFCTKLMGIMAHIGSHGSRQVRYPPGSWLVHPSGAISGSCCITAAHAAHPCWCTIIF